MSSFLKKATSSLSSLFKYCLKQNLTGSYLCGSILAKANAKIKPFMTDCPSLFIGCVLLFYITFFPFVCFREFYTGFLSLSRWCHILSYWVIVVFRFWNRECPVRLWIGTGLPFRIAGPLPCLLWEISSAAVLQVLCASRKSLWFSLRISVLAFL